MEDFESLSEKLARVTNECELLREENSRLRELLKNQPIPRTEGSIPDSKPASATSDQNAAADCGATKAAVAVPAQAAPELSTVEKISLFRALFRGREDVFAVRWESGEKAGYSPASIRDWTALRGVSKSEWKKRDKATRQLLPLTDQAIHDHLSGKTTIGVYPLLHNETCWFLAVDFDQKTWKDDASSFVDSCREWSVPAALERSRSGKGAHVWVFFAAPVAATFARRLGAALLTRTMERRHQLGLAHTIVCFPIRTRCRKAGSEI